MSLAITETRSTVWRGLNLTKHRRFSQSYSNEPSIDHSNKKIDMTFGIFFDTPSQIYIFCALKYNA